MAKPGQKAIHPFQQHQSEVNNGITELAEKIRTSSQEQVEIWRRLPYLALRAEGVTGHSDRAYQLYEYGLLRVCDRKAVGLFGTFIDCETGDIQSLEGPADLGKLATDIEVVKAWLPNGSAFDAQQQLQEYQERADRPFASEESERTVRAWQDSRIKALGLILEPAYVRTDVAQALEVEESIRHL